MNKGTRKLKIAFLGGGAHTIPTYRALLQALSNESSLYVYSEFYLYTSDHREPYRLKTVPKGWIPRRMREIWFGMMVLIDHLILDFDIIHAHSTFPSGYAGAIITTIFRVPLLVSLDAAEGVALSDIQFGDLLNKKRAKANKYVLTKASIITALTKFHRDSIVQNIFIEKPVRVVFRGIDLQRFFVSPISINSPVRFLNVAYMHPVKDQKTLLRTFALISKSVDATLVQVGQDYMDGGIKKFCEELGISDKVRFVGHVQYDKMPHYYQNADVLLHTSRYESAAMVASEALACGILVCGTHVGLMADLSGESCVTAPVGNHQLLSTKVLELLNDPNRIETMRKNGRRWAEQYDLQWTVRQYLGMYEELASG